MANRFLASMIQETESFTSARDDTGIRNKYNDQEYQNAVVRFPADGPSTFNPYGDRYASVEIGRIAEVTASIMSDRGSSLHNELRYEITKLHDIMGKQRDTIESIKGMTQFLMDENASLRSAIKILTDSLEKRQTREKKNKQRGATNV